MIPPWQGDGTMLVFVCLLQSLLASELLPGKLTRPLGPWLAQLNCTVDPFFSVAGRRLALSWVSCFRGTINSVTQMGVREGVCVRACWWIGGGGAAAKWLSSVLPAT